LYWSDDIKDLDMVNNMSYYFSHDKKYQEIHTLSLLPEKPWLGEFQVAISHTFIFIVVVPQGPLLTSVAEREGRCGWTVCKATIPYLLAAKHKQKDKAVVTPTTATTTKNVTPASDDEKPKPLHLILPISPTMLSGCNKWDLRNKAVNTTQERSLCT
jgi:hypothetical protein